MTPTAWPVTGMGAVTSRGEGVPEVFGALCRGESGLAPLRGFAPDRFRAASAYEIDDRTAVGPTGERPGRATDWLCRAVAEATAAAGLGEDLGDVPVLIGTGLRELRSAELGWRDGTGVDPERLHFGTALRERFGAADTHTFSNACSASLYALALAADLLADEAADTVVVAGVDTITESMFGLLDRVHPEPVDAVRPFDRNRRGVLMGDGAAAVVLQRPDVAAVPPQARLRGVGINCDAFHVTAPDQEGIAGAVRTAHDRAGVVPADIDLLMVHGTGTLLNDEAEATALGKVFAGVPTPPVTTAIKSMTGHTSGGSGLLSLVVAARALATGEVPGTVGLDDPVEEAAWMRFVRRTTRYPGLRLAQVDAFGFGGVNAVAVIEAGEDR